MRRVSNMRSGRPEQTATQSVAGKPASAGMSRRTMMKTVGLGTAALALIAGCLETTDPRESRSLEQAVRAMLGDLPADADRKPA